MSNPSVVMEKLKVLRSTVDDVVKALDSEYFMKILSESAISSLDKRKVEIENDIELLKNMKAELEAGNNDILKEKLAELEAKEKILQENIYETNKLKEESIAIKKEYEKKMGEIAVKYG